MATGHDTITFHITSSLTGRTMPADLPARFRSEARHVLSAGHSDCAGKAAAYLDCADRLEAALKAQAEAIKATAAPLRKPLAKPKKK